MNNIARGDVLIAGVAGLVAGALSTAATFAVGAALPLATAALAPSFWGALAMALTAGVGAWFGTAV